MARRSGNHLQDLSRIERSIAEICDLVSEDRDDTSNLIAARRQHQARVAVGLAEQSGGEHHEVVQQFQALRECFEVIGFDAIAWRWKRQFVERAFDWGWRDRLKNWGRSRCASWCRRLSGRRRWRSWLW